MTREERSSYWRSLISKQIESGLTAAAFCKEHRINPGRFYHWRRRLQYEASDNTPLGAFVELVPYQKDAPSGVHIRVSNSLCIEVDRGFDPVATHIVTITPRRIENFFNRSIQLLAKQGVVALWDVLHIFTFMENDKTFPSRASLPALRYPSMLSQHNATKRAYADPH